ncbi:L,D-transpeptidase [Actinocorallia longicatena]|uniref:Ig-like domain-containing protein n=1 Tax=Actinocorallia longicatena TaxID=111803 RepID=A0ABP6Q9P9_9ACTN
MTHRKTAALTGAALLLTAACSTSKGGDDPGTNEQAKPEASAPQLTISPADGTGKVKPESKITVTAANGSIETVKVTVGGRKVPGEMSADKASWKSAWTLKPGATYKVEATAANPENKSTTASSTFKTLKAAATFGILDITPSAGEKVGVGMPITVTFDREITDRKSVERALEVRSDKAATGAWYWTAGNQAIFRTKNGKYWAANQNVRLIAHLTGAKAAKGVYGTADKSLKFKIGDSHISVVDTKKKHITVRINGKKKKYIPISAGKGGRFVGGVDTYLTTSGVHLTMQKYLVETMTSAWMGVDPKDKKNGGYEEKIPYAVRISDSGEYVHSMASRVWGMGRYNLSHGCVNAPPAFAQWFYGIFQRGDVVTVTGTKRKLAWNNGWSFYQMPWKEWVKGGALDREISTGPAADEEASPSPAPSTPASPSVSPSAPVSPSTPVSSTPSVSAS